jgi:hypothetical protein
MVDRAGRSFSDPDCVNVVVMSRSISDLTLDHKHAGVISCLRQR